ncbi:MAG: histidine kinase [Treponema sp.]|jgi:two-component system sensor histidine kinase YesM|nr:histidine kinase [Treponema sp.]
MKINKVSYKIFLGMTLLSSIILIIMSILVKTSYSDSLKKNEINVHVRATIRSKYQLDYIMGVIDSAARDISASAQIIGALTAGGKDIRSGEGDFSVNTFLQSLQTIQPFIGDITIVGIRGQFFSSNLAIEKSVMLGHFGKYVDGFRRGSGAGYFVDIKNAPYSANTYNNLLTGVWPIFETKTQELWGAIFVSLSYAVFQELFILSPLTNDEKFLMVNNAGEIVYTYPAYESFEKVLTEYPAILENADITIEGKFGGKDYVIVSEVSGILGWKFIRVIDAKNVTTDTRKMQGYFNGVFIVSIVIIILFSFYISQVLTAPVQQLFNTCKLIEKGDLSKRVHIVTGDEMGQLGRTFNLIMDQINANFEKELVEQKRKNELRLEVLQSQINPHFLYNTLDSIQFLATLQEVHNIASMCQDLINLLKYNLSSKSTARLYEEVESIKNYAGIQKYRYGDIFELKTAIGEGTENCVISRFVLQPLVENAIIHGFDDMESGGEIAVRSFLEGSNLCLEVSDNGCGMNASTLMELNSAGSPNRNLIASKKSGANVGIANIRERIRLQFNEGASLSFKSLLGKGTAARLVFPVRQPD